MGPAAPPAALTAQKRWRWDGCNDQVENRSGFDGDDGCLADADGRRQPRANRYDRRYPIAGAQSGSNPEAGKCNALFPLQLHDGRAAGAMVGFRAGDQLFPGAPTGRQPVPRLYRRKTGFAVDSNSGTELWRGAYLRPFGHKSMRTMRL